MFGNCVPTDTMFLNNYLKGASMKKIIILIVLAIVIAGSVFAQGETTANVRTNWISGEISLFGLGARYERMLNENISIGVNVYWNNLLFFWNELGTDVSVRFYPWGRIFFIGAALGFHGHSGAFDYEYTDGSGETQAGTWFGTINGVGITPEIGWKIDVGAPGGFFIQPGMKLPITFGALEMFGTDDNEFRTGIGFVVYLGLGYAF